VEGIQPLPASESASVPATARKQTRYLFALPAFKPATEEGRVGRFKADLLPPADTTLTLRGVTRPRKVRLLGGAPLPHQFADGLLTIELPATRRTNLPDVVEVELGGA
jgi:alpha-L-fucosidase